MNSYAAYLLSVGLALASACFGQGHGDVHGDGTSIRSDGPEARTILLNKPTKEIDGIAGIGDGLFKYGVPQRIDLDFIQEAVWSGSGDSIEVGRLKVKSPNAKTLSVFFSSMMLAGNAELFIQGSGGVRRGEYTRVTPTG